MTALTADPNPVRSTGQRSSFQRLRCALAAGSILLLHLTTACAGAPEPEGPRINTAEDLLAALQGAGVEVADTAMMAPEMDLSRGRVVFLGDERVEIYEEDSQPAQRVAVGRLLQRLPGERTPDVWARGRVIVIYRGSDGATAALLSGLLGDSLSLAASPDEPYPPAVAAAIGWWAEDIGVEPGRVIVESFDSAEWPDACLGLARADEACAGVVTPGWHIALRAGDQSVNLHTDNLGTEIRQEP